MIRSMLFVPASRPDMIEKALNSAADAVCIDLEDSVAPADKPAARANVALRRGIGMRRPAGLPQTTSHLPHQRARHALRVSRPDRSRGAGRRPHRSRHVA